MVALNYKLTKRRAGQFRKDTKEVLTFSNTLNKRILQYQEMWLDDFKPNEYFKLYDYLAFCAGHDYLPKKHFPILEYYQIQKTHQRLLKVETQAAKLVSNLVTQSEYFQQLERIQAFQNTKF